MTLIDQRILIPAPIQTVWQIVADHHQLPQWRSDVTTVSILTTKSDTVGTRRRITPKGSRKDVIEEITAWYAGVGYEYHLIQGSTYKNFISRVRLQSTPDGTIVQWTIAFDVGGLLKRFFTGRRRRKRLENITATSLRQLRRHIERLGITLDQKYRDKRIIQKAPDAQYRAEYGAKLFAQTEQTPPTEQHPSITQTLADEEPPIRIDDTPSVPKVPPPSFIAEALTTSLASDADETVKEPEPSVSQEDTKPTSPFVLDTEAKSAENKLEAPSDEMSSLTSKVDSTSVNGKVATKPKRPDGLDKTIAEESTTKLADENTDPSQQKVRSDLPPPTAKRDTGEISIWDAFGVNRPKDELTATIDELLKTPDTDRPTKSGKSSSESDSSSASTQATSSEHPSLDEWLAANEPPLPSSASESVRTLARPPRKTVRGLRRLQKQSRHAVRRPKRPTDDQNVE